MAGDDTLLLRLPLPLSHLLRRAANAKASSDKLLTSYYAWEAALKLLGSVAVVEYAALERRDDGVDELLKNLARPTVGRWWEFVRRLLPILAETGDPGFAHARKLVLGRTRDDLPFAAGLDGALREVLEEEGSARTTVRLTELFNRLVAWRNRELGHGAAGQKSDAHYEKLGRTMFSGVRDVLGKLDVLAGRRLLYVTDVFGRPSGDWAVECDELRGESPKRIATVSVPKSKTPFLVRPQRVYLGVSGPGGREQSSTRLTFRSLHPLVLFDNEDEECFIINSRRGQRKAEYLCYTTGEHMDREGLETDRRELLVRVLRISDDGEEATVQDIPEENEGPPGPDPQSPTHTLGEFELLSKIGQGGMGIVYRAWQPSLGRQVAVKSLIGSGEPEAENRFRREIRALGRVEHPNVAKIYTSGIDGDNWYYAMELVEGAALADIQALLADTSAAEIRTPQWQEAISSACERARTRERSLSTGSRPGAVKDAGDALRNMPDAWRSAEPAAPNTPAPVEHVVEVIRQAAEATHSLHGRGVVHRDIKPGNIMISADGRRAVLMDLGVAQLADESEGRLTRTGQFVGTLRYASPEQIACPRGLDFRTDVYSLGATLWELLTLRPLFGAVDETPPADLMVAIQQKPPERIRSFNPNVPSDLEAVVFKCLEKDRRRRYQTAGELAEDLRRWQQGDTVRARPLTPWYFLERKLARNRKKLASGAVGVLCLALILSALLAYFWPKRDETERRVRYATQVQALPGLDGGWWFAEDPWLVPPVRAAIARAIRDDELPLVEGPGPAEKSDKRQVRSLLRRLFDDMTGPQPDSRRSSLQDLVNELDQLTKGNMKPDERCTILKNLLQQLDESPEDVHTKAVLHHQLAQLGRGDKDSFIHHWQKAKEFYGRAEETYDDGCPLRYLCLTDHAQLLRTRLFDENGKRQTEVLKEMERCLAATKDWQHGPGVFLVYARVTHATALLAARKYEDADDLFKITLDLAGQVGLDEQDDGPGHSLVARTHEEYAWSLMDQWRVEQAVVHFEAASEIRLGQAESGDRMAWTRYYHDLHGLAMAKRYCGRAKEARNDYKLLVGLDGKSGKIGETLEELNSRAGGGSDVGPRQRALQVRLQNSCERRADCELYGWTPFAPKSVDLRLAAALYGRAMELAEDRATSATMGYKRILTLLLDGDREEAEFALRAWGTATSNVVVSTDSYARRVKNLRSAIDALSKPAREERLEALRQFLRQMERERDRPANDNRDTYELRLLCAKRLLSGGRDALEETDEGGDALSFVATVLDDISEKRKTTSDQEYRGFLRGYWDLAIDAVVRADPDQAGRHLEHSDDDSHWRWVAHIPKRPILAVHLPKRRVTDGLVIVLEPSRPSGELPDVSFFHLAFGWDEVQKSRSGGIRLRVPRELARYLRRKEWKPIDLNLCHGELKDQRLVLESQFEEFGALLLTGARENGSGDETSAGSADPPR